MSDLNPEVISELTPAQHLHLETAKRNRTWGNPKIRFGVQDFRDRDVTPISNDGDYRVNRHLPVYDTE